MWHGAPPVQTSEAGICGSRHDRHYRIRTDRPRPRMALASDVSFLFRSSRVPLLEGALECVRAGYIPAGLKNNRDFADCVVEYDDGVPQELRALLFDPQTAGGLLIATPEAGALVKALKDAGVAAAIIGEVLSATKPRIRVAA